MRIYLSLLVAFLALTNAALGGVGDVGVSDGFNLQPSSSYMAGAVQQGGLASQTPGLQLQNDLAGSSGYPAPQDSSLQPSGFQQPLSGSNPDQYTQAAQMGVPQENEPFVQSRRLCAWAELSIATGQLSVCPKQSADIWLSAIHSSKPDV